MLFTTNLLSLLLLATSTLSSPVPEPEPTAEAPEKRSLGGVYFCNDINWGAPCYHRTQEIAVCKDLSSTYAGKVSSIGPDKGTKCSVYSYVVLLPFALFAVGRTKSQCTGKGAAADVVCVS